MTFRLQKPVFVAISLTLAVIFFVILLPSPHGNNPPVPPDSQRKDFTLGKWERGQAVPACFLATPAVE